MIRQDVEKKITEASWIDWELKLHTNNVSYETLEVNSSGELQEREEPSSNSYHVGTYVLFHTYGNIPCNCDWCHEWDNNVDDVQEDFECKSDFIQACIDNNGSNVEDYILQKLEEIPYGFFDDEKEA